MEIRKGTVQEFKDLWNNSNTTTYRYFLSNVMAGNVDFWTIDLKNDLIGELYVFWDSPDKDEANGIDRAYLCAFRIKPEYQNKGYGKQLLSTVVDEILGNGFTEITIGIDNREYLKLDKLYSSLGFTQVLKEKSVDLHYLDRRGKPQTYLEPYKLMIKKEKQ